LSGSFATTGFTLEMAAMWRVEITAPLYSGKLLLLLL